MTHPLTDSYLQSYYKYGDGPYDEDQMRDVADWQLEQVVDAWNDALQSDLENGVKSLNERAARELAAKYPKIFAFGQVLKAMRPNTTQEDN